MLKGLKNLIFEEQEKPAQAPVAPLTSTSAPAMFVPGNDKLYQRLVEATQFEKTKVGQILSKYLAPLATLPLPPEMKLKTAATQAQSLDGVLPSAVIGAYDEMKEALTTEQLAFAREESEFEHNEIVMRQDKIKDITTEIEAIQKKLAETQQALATETSALQSAQANHTQLKTQFTLALQRRQAEVEQEKVKTSTIING